MAAVTSQRAAAQVASASRIPESLIYPPRRVTGRTELTYMDAPHDPRTETVTSAYSAIRVDG